MNPVANFYVRVTVVRASEQLGSQLRSNYLPMEVCKIVKGQRYSKRLNEREITALLKVTCQHPHERQLDIMQTANFITIILIMLWSSKQKLVRSFHLSIVKTRTSLHHGLYIAIPGKKRIACHKLVSGT